MIEQQGCELIVSRDNSKLLDAAHSQKAIRLDVQGLRAVAVLAVFAFHSNSAWLSAGFVGVDIFFVISGFIITALLVERSESINLLAFYGSRIKRILPAYFVMLVVVALVSAILLLPADFDFFFKSFKSASLFSSNNYFAEFGSYFAPRVEELPLLHTWSLAIEMQFYLIFPLFIVCLPRRWLVPAFVLLAAALYIWSGFQALDDKSGKFYFSLSARIPEFLMGALVALTMKGRDLPLLLASIYGLLGALLITFSAVAIDKQSFPGFWSVLPCLGAVLVIAARRGPVNSLLASAPMVWIGGVSYSLYLWHWPILAFVRYYTGQYELTLTWLVACIICSFLFAWLSCRFIETPIRKVNGLRQHWLKLTGVAICFVVVVALARQMNGWLVEPLPLEMTRYAPPEQICHGVQVGSCKRGSADVEPSVLVLGDSHAAQLNLFFDELGNITHTAYRVLTGSSCVPIPGFDVERLPGWAQKACTSQIEAVVAELPTARRIIIAGMWQYQMQSPAFVDALQRFLAQSAAAHKQVLVLAQVPMFDTDVMRVRRFTELGLPAPLIFNKEWNVANQKVEAAAKGLQGVHFLNFSESSFFEQAPYLQGALIYRDSHHLNEVGARLYGRFAATHLQRAFDNP